MRVAFVVLCVNDVQACRAFWVDQLGMVEKMRSEAGPYVIPQVGFADQDFAFQSPKLSKRGVPKPIWMQLSDG